ncbi:MAG: RNA polymerase-binding protein DksA [Proteobacteria bacterium]|nr:RNA polymerase-binding protein DksA [Pseudomonadota bacterium]MBU1139359.1 RNA polymerase-binding protein DksA [Pseudomonadota bacterium]MBU1231813.1 RNA polymerase-binding protein DksA [Pseudomonadota bacterium]MBU1419992.1 RNA polymerase-binding protein DksA [Pseudomonadota bacterium]MBU1454775.1 RNA polymerase-binding protein DksA [Pseudomonadota bacterium]
MDQNVLDKFKKQLVEKREDILKDADRTLSELTDQNGNIPDPNDRATAESDRNFELHIRNRERKLLAKIEAALQRIEDGEYGECASCGDLIGMKRLEARPVTTLCIECKTIQESKEKSRGK